MKNDIVLYNDDCYKILPTIPNESIDLIIIDPPYVGLVNEKWDKKDVVTDELAKHLYRILKPTGSFYCWCGIGEKSQTAIDWFLIFRKHFYFKDWIVWKKQRGLGNRRGWLFVTEYIQWFVKDNNQFIWNKDFQYGTETYHESWQKRLGRKHKRLTNVWIDIVETDLMRLGKVEKIKHETPKPIKAIERIIKAHTKEGDVVLDCFLGSGTTAVACQKLNRQCIGIEINETYFNLIHRRLLNTSNLF